MPEAKKQVKKLETRVKIIAWCVFFAAFLIRIYILFFVTDPENAGPGWYGDVYHHWQIAYLSKTVGFNESFLRLWDLRGLEYYWGLLHPLILAAVMAVFNTTSVLVPRLVSAVFGAGVCALVFLIINRKFNLSSALASGLIFAVFPVTSFSDSIGMQEPLGLFLLLLGIYNWPRHPGVMGLLFMLSGMVRSEYWIFGALMLLYIILRTENTNHKITAIGGYLILAIFYMKYLLDYTGNPIYPIWTAYLATFIGHWFADVPIIGEKSLMQQVSRVILGVSVLGVGFVFWKKPKGYLYWILGLFNIMIFSALHGVGAYVKGFEGKVLVDRLLAFPYAFLGSALSVFLFYSLPHKLGHYFKIVSWSVVLVLLAASMYLWQPIMYYHNLAKATYASEIDFANVVVANYPGSGAVVVPYGRAVFIYGLVNKNNVTGEKIVSSFYDPFFYASKETDVFSNWEDFRGNMVKWYLEKDVSLLVAPKDGSSLNYFEMYKFEQGRTMEIALDTPYYTIYRIEVKPNDPAI